MAVGVLAGLALPPLATLARPLLVPTLLIPLAIALVRLDWSAIAAWRQRPLTIAALLVFVLGVSPLVVWVLVSDLEPLGFPRPLAQALILMAASSPIVSNVALALILRLDAPLAVVVVMLATALVPFTLPPIAGALAGIDVELPVLEFSLRLAALVGGAFAAAALVRRFVPRETLAANADWLDGFTVVNLLLFGLAIMDGVTAFALERPGYVALALLAAYAFNLALQAGAGLAFRSLGTTRALTVALARRQLQHGPRAGRARRARELRDHRVLRDRADPDVHAAGAARAGLRPPAAGRRAAAVECGVSPRPTPP